ncbi:HamA C-terminal domain-containing protein [Pseudomonas huaxiensis]|uniref:HamA C-terminal domain-containing protein n=1 Tax=Pseudomonas huaxiensis TaxID=2213017 RepID=UPI0015AFDAD2|nr:DUF1837 domain-containing protein [Pseudomonas huaxiensis]
MDFEVLIDSSFVDINIDPKLVPIENKRVLSLINDFEDGDWRYAKFSNFIWDNVAQTALSHKERKSLEHQSQSMLVRSAENLRLTDKEEDISKGSELAEIVLYAIMKHKYKAFPVVPKIFYKQNSQDNAKGADSVHIVPEGDNEFSLWFGEAKFYNSIEDARLPSIITSVGNSLKTDKLKKETSIITNLADIDELEIADTLKEKIKSSLAHTNSIDTIKPIINIPILLLHECEITNTCTSLSSEYKNNIINFHTERSNSYFKKQISKLNGVHLYEKIKFHIILFPVPEKECIVDTFVNTAEHYKTPPGKKKG